MEKKSLIYTNPYLKDPILREKLIARSVETSGNVEGITVSKTAQYFEIRNRKDKKIYHST